VKRNGHSTAYREGSTDNAIDIANVSTGLKTFVIIKTLLQNGYLEENGIIILDEPEIHLHPEWQLVFAELIILMQKEFNMHILINTHSPYFLDAIEVYSNKHGIANKCRYYLSEISDKISTIKNVTNNIELIYEKLSWPLQVLENERYSDV
jgi:predicted ATPase